MDIIIMEDTVMRKSINIPTKIGIIALVVASITGCLYKEEIGDAFSDSAVEVVFTATREGFGANTKTTLVDNGIVYWNPAEEINVFWNGGSAGKFVSQNTELSETADFAGSFQILHGGDSGGVYLGIYPYSADNTCQYEDPNYLYLVIPSRQEAVEGNFSDNVFPSIARSFDRNLRFYNICGGIKFSVSRNDIEKITFRGNSGEVLAGKVCVDFDYETGKPYVFENLTSQVEITIQAPGGGCFEPGKYYYMTMLPADLTAGFTMTFFTAESVGSVFSDDSRSIKRSIFGVLHNVDSYVEDWALRPLSLRPGSIVESDGLGIVVHVDDDNNLLLMSVEELRNQTWNNSNAWCHSYGESWRMPTIDELTLIHNNFRRINTELSNNGYTPVSKTDTCYWSGTQNPQNESYYYRERLYDGRIFANIGVDEKKTSTANYTRAVKIVPAQDVIQIIPENYCVLSQYSAELISEESLSLTAYVSSEDADNRSFVWTSSDDLIASVDEDGNVTAHRYGTAVITVSVGGLKASCEVSVDYDWIAGEPVDLGLGVFWSSTNLGAKTPYENGAYFAWSETYPKQVYSETQYKWRGNSEDYPSSVQQDAASVLLGNGWRMPTHNEWNELLANCDLEKKDSYILVTSRINGNSIVLPKASCLKDESLFPDTRNFAYYWAKDAYYWKGAAGFGSYWPYYLVGTQQGPRIEYSYQIYGYSYKAGPLGMSIRPVCPLFVQSISVSESSLELEVGDSAELTVTLLPEKCSNKAVCWTSSDEAVVTVSDAGVVVAVGPGQATITAESDGLSATCNVTVPQPIQPVQIAIGEIVDAGGLGIVVHVNDNNYLLMSVSELKDRTWPDSNAWCNSYGEAWRMPTIEELSFISSNFSTINTALSKGGYTTLSTANKCYWSGTQNPEDGSYYYRERLYDGWVLTNTGDDERITSTNNYTRAVKTMEREWARPASN